MAKRRNYSRSYTSRGLRKLKNVATFPKRVYTAIRHPSQVKRTFVEKHPLPAAALGLAGSAATVVALRLGAPIAVGFVTKRVGRLVKGKKPRFSRGSFIDPGNFI